MASSPPRTHSPLDNSWVIIAPSNRGALTPKALPGTLPHAKCQYVNKSDVELNISASHSYCYYDKLVNLFHKQAALHKQTPHKQSPLKHYIRAIDSDDHNNIEQAALNQILTWLKVIKQCLDKHDTECIHDKPLANLLGCLNDTSIATNDHRLQAIKTKLPMVYRIYHARYTRLLEQTIKSVGHIIENGKDRNKSLSFVALNLPILSFMNQVFLGHSDYTMWFYIADVLKTYWVKG